MPRLHTSAAVIAHGVICLERAIAHGMASFIGGGAIPTDQSKLHPLQTGAHLSSATRRQKTSTLGLALVVPTGLS